MLINPKNVPETTGTNYPEPFKAIVAGRTRKRLGEAAQLKNFGVNLVKLAPGSASSVRHWHSQQDELIYLLEGEVTLVSDDGEQLLKPGDAAGFPAAEANGHHLINRSDAIAVYLEIGDRSLGDQVYYPDADLVAQKESQGWAFTHKDGRRYE
ncbi:MAG: cupin domain-containing protein [Cyanophyceae cyanobacterium]